MSLLTNLCFQFLLLFIISRVFILWYRVCFQRVSAICSSINDELSLSTFCFSASSHSNVNVAILLHIIIDWLRNNSSVLVNLILNFEHSNIPEWSEFRLESCLLVWMLKDFLSFFQMFPDTFSPLKVYSAFVRIVCFSDHLQFQSHKAFFICLLHHIKVHSNKRFSSICSSKIKLVFTWWFFEQFNEISSNQFNFFLFNLIIW